MHKNRDQLVAEQSDGDFLSFDSRTAQGFDYIAGHRFRNFHERKPFFDFDATDLRGAQPGFICNRTEIGRAHV